MSPEFYKVLHLCGVFMVLAALGGIALHMINGGTRAYGARKFAAMSHGIGLLLALVGGFGLLAKGGFMAGGMPGWAIGKLLIWLAFGMMPVLLYRMPKIAKMLSGVVIVLAVIAAWLVVYKPF